MLLVAAATVFAFAPVAGATTTIGSSLADAPNNGTCMSPPALDSASECTIMQTSLAPGSTASGGLAAPSLGVIVRWRTRSSSGVSGTIKVTPRVFIGSIPTFTGTQVTLANTDAVQEFPERLPIQQNQTLGVNVSVIGMMVTAPIINVTPGVGHWNFWMSPVADGANVTPFDSSNEVELLVNADIETDADADGWGDETQDACPGVTGATAGCPEAQAILPPPPATPKQVVTHPEFSLDRKSLFVNTSLAGSLAIKLERSAKGRKSAGKCKAKARTGKKCAFYKLVKSSTAQVTAGLNRLNFSTLRGSRPLAPGRYRISFGNATAKPLTFTIKR